MRALLSAVALFAAGPALAQSIDLVKSLPAGAAPGSVTVVACPDCPSLQPVKSAYDVPPLPAGQQTVELRTVSGKQLIYRTEAWLGGSPVTFVSTPTPEMIAALTQKPVKGHNPMGDGIDTGARTAAVKPAPLQIKAPVEAAMGAPAPKAPAALDTSGFSLRN